jgi:hypothetical protein
MPSVGNGEVFRVKAVCTFVRHDPVYKVKKDSILKKKAKFILRLVLVWIVKRS